VSTIAAPTPLARIGAIAAVDPGRVAVVGPAGERIGYGELLDGGAALAGELAALGIAPGEPVALLGDNSPDWVRSTLAIWSLGATVVGLNTWSPLPELRKVVGLAGIATVIGCLDGEQRDAYTALARGLTEEGSGRRLVEVRDGRCLGAATGAEPVRRAPAAGEVAAMCFTSGSTAAPKGVMLSHGALARGAAAIGEAQGIREGDVVWSHFPFFFSGGLCNFLMGGLMSGASLVIQPRFEPEPALDAIEGERATVIHAWPNVVRRLVDSPEFAAERIAALRTGTWPLDLWYGGEGFGQVRGINLFGMTETCTIFTATTAEDSDAVRADTHGRPFEGNEAKIVDAEGKRLSPGERGQIRLKGFNLMSGYFGRDAGEGFDEEGFLLTSDVGELNDDGYLIWAGRGDDMIRTRGIIVSPAEVEFALEGMPGVAKAGVVGKPDERRGEAVVAYIAVEGKTSIDETAVLDWCRENIAGYKVPSVIKVVDPKELPLLGSGKVDRRRLRELVAGQA
jgi:fatty-acyl-CoA synthase